MRRQKRISKALAELALLNDSGQVISEDILGAFKSDLPTLDDLSVKSAFQLVELLSKNPIQFSLDSKLQRRLDDIAYLIEWVSMLDLSRVNKSFDDLPDTLLTPLYLNAITLWDKTWEPTFEKRMVMSRELFWLIHGNFLKYHNPIVVHNVLEVVRPRLPESDEAWKFFYEHSPDAYYYLSRINKQVWKNNEYRNYYFAKKAREHFGQETVITEEWALELFDYPLNIPNFYS